MPKTFCLAAHFRPPHRVGWLLFWGMLAATDGRAGEGPGSAAARLEAVRVQPPQSLSAAPSGRPAGARTIRLETSQAPVYTVIHLTEPERLVVDLAATALDGLSVPSLDPHDPWFANLATQQLSAGREPIARVVLTLQEGVLVDVGREARAVVIHARGTQADPTPQQLAAAALKRLESSPVARRDVPLRRAPARPAALPIDAAVPRPPVKAARPTLVGILCLTASPARETFSLNVKHPAAAAVARPQRLDKPARYVVDLPGVALPDLQRHVSLTRQFVRQVRLAPHGNGTRAVFDLRGVAVTPSVQRSPRGYTVAFDRAPTAPPKPAWTSARRHTAEAPLSIRVAAPQTASFVSTAGALARSVAAGSLDKLISLDVRDADIINVLRLISEETGENIITSDEVKGRVTLRLRNVPADQALDTMLRTKGFDRVRHNNIIRVASAESIQKERDLDVARRRAALEVEETVIRMETVNYATASEIVDQIKPMLTGRGSIQVNARTNTLILQDVPANVDRLVGLARRLDKQTPLVMIQARIVEANTSSMQDLGIQWGGSSQETSRTHNPTGLMFPGDVVLTGGADSATNQVAGIATPAHYAVNLPATLSGQGAGLGFILGSANGSQILNLRLSAMESNGNGKVISSPEVATLDNKTARVSQGVEIPVSVTSAAGVNTRFVPAVLELEVTPHVTNDGTVLLRIKTQKSEADFTNRGAAGDPTIQKRYAETEVLVRDGDTSVIGGIYTRNTGDTYNAVPFISRIPLIGSLFRRHAHSDTRAELLVFITPRIINREESMIHNNSTPKAASPGSAGAPAK